MMHSHRDVKMSSASAACDGPALADRGFTHEAEVAQADGGAKMAEARRRLGETKAASCDEARAALPAQPPDLS